MNATQIEATRETLSSLILLLEDEIREQFLFLDVPSDADKIAIADTPANILNRIRTVRANTTLDDVMGFTVTPERQFTEEEIDQMEAQRRENRILAHIERVEKCGILVAMEEEGLI